MVNEGQAQRSVVQSVTLTFDRVVAIDQDGGDPFHFWNVDKGVELIDLPSVSIDELGRTVVEFQFLEGPSVSSSGGLQNGTYRLAVDADLVSGPQPLDGDGDGNSGGDYHFGVRPADAFYRFYGDGNGNGVVDLLDFAAFRGTFGRSFGDPGYNGAFDSNGDQSIGLIDFVDVELGVIWLDRIR